jgi:hypothetical protein
MNNNDQTTILKAFRLVLQPLARILLRSGITWNQFSLVCKTTLVDVATKEFGLHGRPTNMSRVAIMTGLGRREVSRLRKMVDEEQPADFRRLNGATRLLTGWHLDAAYQDDDGNPLQIPFAGEGETFTALAREYSADIAPVTLLRELMRVGAVAEGADGAIRVVKRYYMPRPMDADAVFRAGSVLQDIGNSVDYNLVRQSDEPTRFEGRATSANLRAVDAAKYREFLEAEGQAFLERVDEWLARNEHSTDSSRSYKLIRAGVGIYQIQDDQDRE